jgi:hypothetical protein
LQGASIEPEPEPEPAPSPALSNTVINADPIEPPTYTTATATDNTAATSPLATPKSYNDPNSGLIFGPSASPSPIAAWFDKLETRLLALKASDFLLPSAREQYFDSLIGNCTTPAKQWEVDISHQKRADKERKKRYLETLEAQRVFATKVFTDLDLPPVAGTATGGPPENLRLRRVMARSDLSAASVASVVGQAAQRRGSEFERLSRC